MGGGSSAPCPHSSAPTFFQQIASDTLDPWLSTTDSYAPPFPAPGEVWQSPETFLVVSSPGRGGKGCCQHLAGSGQPPTPHKTAPQWQRIIWPQVPVILRLRNPFIAPCTSHWANRSCELSTRARLRVGRLLSPEPSFLLAIHVCIRLSPATKVGASAVAPGTVLPALVFDL